MIKKVKKTFILMLMMGFLIVFLRPAEVCALTEAEKNEAFQAALMELEEYLENPGAAGRSLDACISKFSDLETYNSADAMKIYAMSLQMIEEGRFTRTLNMYLKSINTEGFSKFISDLDDKTPLCTPDILEAYKEGREAELNGDVKTAIASYERCLDFYDSRTRYILLCGSMDKEAYERGLNLYDEGDLAGAYYALQDCTGYELTDFMLASIVEELGYVPSSPTDNPCKHEWLEATCTAPRTCKLCGETEGEPLGHKWKEATCTTAKTCTVCGKTEGSALGHDWQPATYDAPETCFRCGETRGEPAHLFAFNMTLNEYDERAAQLIQPAKTWTKTTAPQSLEEFPLFPEWFDSVMNAESEMVINGDTLIWKTDLDKYLPVDRVWESYCFSYLDKKQNCYQHLDFVKTGDNEYSVHLPDDVIKNQAAFDGSDSSISVQSSSGEFFRVSYDSSNRLEFVSVTGRSNPEMNFELEWDYTLRKEILIRVLRYETETSLAPVCDLYYNVESGNLIDFW